MTIESQEFLTEAFLQGLAHGNQHSVAQLQTLFDSMRDQISRLEANNDKLRARVNFLLQNHSGLERTVLELKARQTSDFNDAVKENSHLQNELEKIRRESSSYIKQLEDNKHSLESCIADKNKILIDMKAENLRLKDQLEEQGLQFAQHQSRSALTKDLINEIRGVVDAVQKVQTANQSLLEKYSQQVLEAKQDCLMLKTINEGLQLELGAKTSAIESYKRKIKGFEEMAFSNSKGIVETDFLSSDIENVVNTFRDHLNEIKTRSQEHVEQLTKLAAFASNELKLISDRADIANIASNGHDNEDSTIENLKDNAFEAIENSSKFKCGYVEDNVNQEVLESFKDDNHKQQSHANDFGIADKPQSDVVVNITGMFPQISAK